VLDARITDEPFGRPADFDLAAFWAGWCASVEENRAHYPVTVRVAPELVPWLPYYFGEPIREAIAQAGSSDGEGWITLPLMFETAEDARERILSLGGSVEILEPRALRNSVVDYAEQILARYAG
jgi:predicted DNA-binding transcriptional regulator YafY